MATSINLTGPLPAPYKVLYGLENMTQELKVGWSGNSKSWDKRWQKFPQGGIALIGKCTSHCPKLRQAAVREIQRLSKPMFFKLENYNLLIALKGKEAHVPPVFGLNQFYYIR